MRSNVLFIKNEREASYLENLDESRVTEKFIKKYEDSKMMDLAEEYIGALDYLLEYSIPIKKNWLNISLKFKEVRINKYHEVEEDNIQFTPIKHINPYSYQFFCF